MEHDDRTGEVTTSIEELAIYNMLLSEALFEILADKGHVTRAEVTERIKRMKSETKVNLRRPN
jgi:hypothetical protein